MSDSLELRVLGPLEATRAGETLGLPGRKARALLALLLLHANEVLSRERLIDGLWGEEPPETVANALQVHVHALRKALGRDRVLTRGAGYSLRVESGELDLERFEELVRAGREALGDGRPEAASRTLRAALSLWRGPALAEHAEEPFAPSELGRLEEARVAALEQRIDADLALGHHDRLIGELEALVTDHPFRERLWMQLMLALYRSGRQAEALEAYGRARAQLVEELGVDPGPELRELEAAILRQEPGLAPEPTARSTEGYLPRAANPLVGRRLELAAVTGLLRLPDVRLVTVTGTGGTGKTRFALAVAEELAPELGDGAHFVDLAPLLSADLVAGAVAGAFGVTEAGEHSLVDALKQALRRRHLLLVLDNFEHVVDAAPLLSELLAAAPGLTMLVTSRASLHLSAEHEYPLAPLEVPSPQAASSLEALAANDAVALFTARARAVRPDFAITAENVASVASICAELDGLPLALELAAARMKLLSPDSLLERLRARRDALGSGARDLPARQQTLRATLDWSYGLLDRDEQEVFARVSVFSGGWTLAAVESVCGAELETVSSLVDKSLVRRRDGIGPEPRFAMLETVREYARERLADAGEEEARRRRHAEHFVAWAEALEPTIRERSTLAALEQEHDNLRAALAFCAEAGLASLQLRLCAAVGRFWYVRGHLSEGRAQIESALAHDDGRLPGRRAAALDGASRLAWVQGDYDACIRFVEESLVLYEDLDDDAGKIRALIGLGLGLQARGELERARSCHVQTLELARKLGRPRDEGLALGNLGDIAFLEGDLEGARAIYGESLVLCREVGDAESTAVALSCLGIVALRTGEKPDEAAQLFRESLGLFRELGFTERVGTCLAGLAAAASAAQDSEHAARLLGAAHALLENIGARADIPWERPLLSETTERLRAQLGDDAFSAAFELGRKAPENIVEVALSGVR